MKNAFKKIILCSILVVSFAFISACGKDEDTGNSNIAPTLESFEIVGENSESLSFVGNNDSVQKLSSSNKENTFGEGKKTIEEKINEEIDVGEQITIDYTADVNEYVYAITKIKNPGGKSISSMTINGQRYTSNLFEDSSSKEKIILKLSVGSESKIKKYTLEKIKYIDGNTSKDATIVGDVEELVQVGTVSGISHQLNNLSVTDSSINFGFKLIDNSSLIENTKGNIKAVLYDGDNLIIKALNVGTQTVNFDGLSPNKKYQYAIVATYDKLDGSGKKNYIVAKDVIITDENVAEPQEYTIGKGATTNGTLTVVNSAQQGDLITVTASPDIGYELKELYYIESGSTDKHMIVDKQFIMPNKNITVYATFKVVVSESGAYTISLGEVIGGTIDIANSASAGDLVTFTLRPNQGLELVEIVYLEEGKSIFEYVEITGNSFIMPEANITIDVLFSSLYTIKVVTENGSIAIENNEQAYAGTIIMFSDNPYPGYILESLYYVEEGSSIRHEIEGNMFTMPAANITIYVIFKFESQGDLYDINVVTENGIIKVSNQGAAGGYIELEVEPEAGYKLENIYYIKDGESTKHEIVKDFFGYSFLMPQGNITIYATFGLIEDDFCYTITTGIVENGAFEVSGCGEPGEYVDFTLIPNQGYKLFLMYYLEEGSTLDDAVFFEENNLIMPEANIVIYAFFEKAYTIDVANMQNGEIFVDSLGIEYETIWVDVVPANGYRLKELYYVQEGSSEKYKIEDGFLGLEFDMPASNITIYAEFEVDNLYTIMKNSEENGSISVTNSAQSGDLITVTVTPDTGYELKELYYIESGSTDKHMIVDKQFIMPSSNIIIYAIFEEMTYQISIGKIQNGSIEIVNSAKAGSYVDYKINVDPGYVLGHIHYVKEGSDYFNLVSGERFLMPSSNITIYVVIRKIHTINIQNIGDGNIDVTNSSAVEGELIYISMNPSPGYVLDELYYLEESSSIKHEIVIGSFISFVMPDNSITIYAVFKSQEFIIIYNKQEFIEYMSDDSNWDESIKLMGDIDLEYMEWTPIGTSTEKSFRGIFDGNGYTIKNLKITKEWQYTGLFGCIQDAQLINVKVRNYQYEFSYEKWGLKVIGGLVGFARTSTIEKSSASGSIYVEGQVSLFSGGLVGQAYDTRISNCYTTGDISMYVIGHYFSVGGLVGEMYMAEYMENVLIEYCYSTVDISVNNYDTTRSHYSLSVGGLVGTTYYEIYNSYATGDVTVTNQNFPSHDGFYVYAGGLVANVIFSVEIHGFNLDSQIISATSSIYTKINEDSSSLSINKIFEHINDEENGWDDEIWNLSLTENPTLK